MHEIQGVALDLFEDRGYRSVSVENVASAAGVSPSTVYRYFGTKEMLVVWDDIDPRVLDVLSAARVATDAAELIAEVTSGARLLVIAISGMGDEQKIQRRMRLMAAESDVRAGQYRQMHAIEEQVRQIIAARLGQDPDDLLPRLLAAQGVWGFMAAIDHWVATGFTEPLATVLNRTIDIMHRSLMAAVTAD